MWLEKDKVVEVDSKYSFKDSKDGQYSITANIVVSSGNYEPLSDNKYDYTLKNMSLSAGEITLNKISNPVKGDPVSLSTGNYEISVADLSIDGKAPLKLERFYNAQDYTEGSLGIHWSHSYEIYYQILDEYIKVYFGNGKIEFFNLNSDGTYDFDESVYDDVYLDENNNLVLSYKDGKQYYFENNMIKSIQDEVNSWSFTYSDQLLQKVESISGWVEFYYNDAQLDYVKDHSGRIVNYEYINGLLTSITNADGHIWSYGYNELGLIEKAIDPYGQVELINEYNSDSQVLKQINEDGSFMTFEYFIDKTVFTDRNGAVSTYYKDDKGRLTYRVYPDDSEKYVFDDHDNVIEFVNKNNQKYTYFYDNNGNMTYTINPLNEKTTYTYDLEDNLIQIIEADGSVYSYEYNTNGDVTSATDPLNRETKFIYDSNFNRTSVILPDGTSRTMTYDEKNNLITETDADGNTKTYVYDALNRIVSISDALGNLTQTDYLPSGRVESITFADKSRTTNTYNALNQLIQQTDQMGHTTSYEYTIVGDVSKIINPDGTVITNEYDVMQNLVKKTYPDGSFESFVYDNANRMIKSVDREGFETLYTYDNNGNIISEKDPNGNTTSYSYDALDRLVSSTDAKGQISSVEYNFDGQIVALIDALNQRYVNVYDEAGQLIKSINENNQETVYAYDALGRKVSETNALGETTTFEYNARNKVTKVTYADGRTEEMSYDGNGNLVTKTNASGATTTYYHDNMNRLNAIKDALGNMSYMTYDLNGQITSETNGNGETRTYSYDVMNRLVSSTDPMGNETKYVYDAMGQVIEIHQHELSADDALTDELITYYEYNNRGEIKKEVSPRGAITIYTYDGNGNLVATVDPLDNETLFEYDVLNNMVSKQLPNGAVETYTYDVLNRLITSRNPLGDSMSIAYDALGNVSSQTDYNGNKTDYLYDALNRMIESRDAKGSTTSFSYNTLGLVTSKTDALGHVYGFEYDALGQLTKETLPTTAFNSYVYDVLGRVIEKTDLVGYTLSYEYDAVGQVVKTIRPDGLFLENTYDENGNLINQQDVDGLNTSFEYDYLNRLLSSTDKLGYSKRFTYDAHDNLTSVIDENGHVTHYSFDLMDRLIEETNALGNVTNYAYDLVGNMTSVTQYKGLTSEVIAEMSNSQDYDTTIENVVVSYDYNLNNNMITETSASGLKKHYTYDANGNMIKKIDEDNYTTTFTYDVLNNLTSVNYANNTSVTYGYNALSQMISMTDSLGTSTYDVDALGRIVSESDFENKVTSFVWHHNNQKSSMTYPDGSLVNYSYTPEGLLETVTDSSGEVTTYDYDQLYRLVEETYPNGMTTSYTYDHMDRILEKSSVKADGTIIQSSSFTYDGVGNKLTENEQAFVNTLETEVSEYGYDALNQLTSLTLSGGLSEKYFYDTVSNRVQKEIINTSDNKPELIITHYVYNNENQLLTLQGKNEEVAGHQTADLVSFNYDNRGNLRKIQTSDGTIGQYFYDARNKLVYSSNKMGILSQYTYDGIGRRIKQTLDASNINVSETSKLYDQDLLEELMTDDNGLVIKDKKSINYVYDVTSDENDVLLVYGKHTETNRYIYGIGLISIDSWHEEEESWSKVSQDNFDVTLYYVKDVLGSVRALVDDSNKINKVYDYDVFGTPVEKNHVNDQGIRTNIYHYAGYIFDYATSQYFVNARYYQPETGRFVAKDLLLVDGFNRYKYVRNNPVKLVDPLGLLGEGADSESKYIESLMSKPINTLSYEECNKIIAYYFGQSSFTDNASARALAYKLKPYGERAYSEWNKFTSVGYGYRIDAGFGVSGTIDIIYFDNDVIHELFTTDTYNSYTDYELDLPFVYSSIGINVSNSSFETAAELGKALAKNSNIKIPASASVVMYEVRVHKDDFGFITPQSFEGNSTSFSATAFHVKLEATYSENGRIKTDGIGLSTSKFSIEYGASSSELIDKKKTDPLFHVEDIDFYYEDPHEWGLNAL